MPIAPELIHFYRTPSWFEARQLVMERAEERCEWCNRPRKQWVLVARDGTGRWFDSELKRWMWPSCRVLSADLGISISDANDILAARASRSMIAEPSLQQVILSVLTTAHLDHDPGNNELSNLAALCQRCHLVYDRSHHYQTWRLRRDLESGQLRISYE
jgi:hypothetical protein